MEYDHDDPPPTEAMSFWFWFNRYIEHVVRFARLFGFIMLCLCLIDPAKARYDPEWENSPPHVRAWFQSLMQPDNPHMSCCGEADAYEADMFEVDGDNYVAIITAQGPAVQKPYIKEGTRINVPNSKMKWDKGNPTGHGIIFIGLQGQIYCYIAPGGV